MSSTDGVMASSKGGLKGTGTAARARRTMGAFSAPKACSATVAAISEAMEQGPIASSTVTTYSRDAEDRLIRFTFPGLS